MQFYWKVTPAKVFSSEFSEVVKNICFVESLWTASSESVMYKVYIFLSEVCLKEEEEYKKYLRITAEWFDKLFVLQKVDITKQILIWEIKANLK